MKYVILYGDSQAIIVKAKNQQIAVQKAIDDGSFEHHGLCVVLEYKLPQFWEESGEYIAKKNNKITLEDLGVVEID